MGLKKAATQMTSRKERRMKYDRKSLSKRIGRALQKYRAEILKDPITKIAKRCKPPVGVSTISKIEGGQGTLNLKTLCNIIKNGYQIDPPILFLHDHNPFFNLARTDTSDKVIHIHKDSPFRVVKPPDSRNNLFYDVGLDGAKIGFRRLILKPGQDSKKFKFHENEEFAYIEEGRDIKFIFENYGVRDLRKGDIIHFAPGLVHKAANENEKITARILVLSPTR